MLFKKIKHLEIKSAKNIGLNIKDGIKSNFFDSISGLNKVKKEFNGFQASFDFKELPDFQTFDISLKDLASLNFIDCKSVVVMLNHSTSLKDVNLTNSSVTFNSLIKDELNITIDNSDLFFNNSSFINLFLNAKKGSLFDTEHVFADNVFLRSDDGSNVLIDNNSYVNNARIISKDNSSVKCNVCTELTYCSNSDVIIYGNPKIINKNEDMVTIGSSHSFENMYLESNPEYFKQFENPVLKMMSKKSLDIKSFQKRLLNNQKYEMPLELITAYYDESVRLVASMDSMRLKCEELIETTHKSNIQNRNERFKVMMSELRKEIKAFSKIDGERFVNTEIEKEYCYLLSKMKSKINDLDGESNGNNLNIT